MKLYLGIVSAKKLRKLRSKFNCSFYTDGEKVSVNMSAKVEAEEKSPIDAFSYALGIDPGYKYFIASALRQVEKEKSPPAFGEFTKAKLIRSREWHHRTKMSMFDKTLDRLTGNSNPQNIINLIIIFYFLS